MTGSYGGSAFGGASYTPGVAQSSFSGTMPYSIVTEIAFASNPLDDTTAAWTDVSKYVQHIQTTRGRQHELNRFEAGTAMMTLDNKDGRFSPFNTSSPYNPNILPYKQIRVRALYNGVMYPIFRGHINAWPVKWPSPADSLVDIQCVDAFKVLNLKKASTLSTYQTTVLADSPSAFLRLNDAPGSTVVADSSGNSRSGTVTAGTSSTLGAAPFVIADSTTGSFDTGARTGIISIGTGPAISGTGAFSVEMWVTPRSIAVDGLDTAYTQDDGLGATGAEMAVSFDPTQKIRFEGIDAAAHSFTVFSNTILQTGTSYHVVCTRTAAGTKANIYINGNLDISSTVTAVNLTAAGICAIGGKINSGGSLNPRFDGVIGEVSVYNTELSATNIAAHYAASAGPLSGQTTGQRIQSLLTAVGWPSSLMKVDTGLVLCQSGSADLVNNTALANMQVTSDTELGELFVGADGSVVFYDHIHKYKSPNGIAALTLGDSGTLGPGGESPYLLDSVDIQFDDLDIYNEVQITPNGRGAQTASNSASQAAYGKRTTSKTTVHLNPTDALNEASFLVGRFKTPLQRIRSLTFTPMSDPTVLLPAALGFDLLTRVTVKRRPKDGAGSTFAQDSLIEGISHSITPGMWQTSYALSPTDASPVPWIIDDPVAGKVVDGGSQSPQVVVGF